MCAAGPTPLYEQPDAYGFGRVTVGFLDRVMHYIAQGPFDATLMAAAKRGTNIAAERIPADRRYVSLMEFFANLHARTWNCVAGAIWRPLVCGSMMRGFPIISWSTPF